jgi:hypothetical protein
MVVVPFRISWIAASFFAIFFYLPKTWMYAISTARK